MNGLFEILSNKEWMIQQEFLHSILPTLQYNITNHATLGIEREKKSPMAIGQKGQDFLREYQVTEDGTVLPTYDGWTGEDLLGKMKEPFVNVMPVDGPITRNGGACSYGSRDIRDWMMKAADNKFCKGHVLHINTPGGSAWAKNDFQQGIDYAHARGQRVIAFIDGLCASAGMYLASLCDEVYVMNLKDQLGCVGVMAAFFTMKNGEKNQFTGETYREYYATKSVNKNKEMRDIAEDDNAKLLIEELDKMEAEFRADMKAAFPKATDEHLDGKIFDAKDVMGVLCDGEMMLGDVIQRVFGLAEGTVIPIERTAGRKIAKSSGKATARETSGGKATAYAKTTDALSTQINKINMKEQFPALFAALQVEEMQMQEGGAFVNTELLANLNAKIETLQEIADNHEQQMADLRSAHEAALAAKDDEHAKAIETLKAEQATAIEEKDNAIAALEQEKADLQAKVNEKQETLDATAADLAKATDDLNALRNDMEGQKAQIEQLAADVDGAKASLTTAEQTIAERDQQISDLNAQIAEMQNEPGNQPAAGAAPANNGGGAEAPGVAVNQFVYDNALSYKENMDNKDKWEAEHGK